jgi:hypothetical protein
MSDTTGIVVFDYSGWQMRYPELACWVAAGLAQAFFLEAQIYLSNEACSPVPSVAKRTVLLNMLVAHIAALNAPLNGEPSPTLVGRIASASEGSVSVSVTMETPGTAAWFNTTKYGAAFYAATASLRTMRYVPGVQPVFDPVGRFYTNPAWLR